MTETIYASWVAPEPYWEGRSWFFEQWRRRHERYKNMLLCATGQSLGIGKSYWLLSCFEEIDPSFRIEQIVFNSEQFWAAVEMLPNDEWHPIMWDDPTRGLNKREWYLDLNKVITSFMKTASRYRRKDLGFAVPSFDDLDIAVREVMVCEGQMKEAGLAKVHRITRNKFGSPPFWKPYLGEVQRKVPRLAKEYEERRHEFHKTSYQQEEFKKKDETPETIFYKVYNAVKANPIRYSMKDRNGKLKLSALMVGSLIDSPCSDQTARRVITRIESEKPDLFSSQQSVR